MAMGRWISLMAAMVVLSTGVHGCTSVTVLPDVAAPNDSFSMEGAIHYEGNSLYLPRVLRAATGASSTAFYYDHHVEYEENDLPALVVLFNPLTILGFPTGSVTVTASAQLEVKHDERAIKHYEARSLVKRTRTLYTAGNLTELRKKGLLAARDNIEAQLAGDSSELEALAHP